MKKSLSYTILVFSLILFFWWFSGGHPLKFPTFRVSPSPAEKLAAFVYQNASSALANILEILRR